MKSKVGQETRNKKRNKGLEIDATATFDHQQMILLQFNSEMKRIQLPNIHKLFSIVKSDFDSNEYPFLLYTLLHFPFKWIKRVAIR